MHAILIFKDVCLLWSFYRKSVCFSFVNFFSFSTFFSFCLAFPFPFLSLFSFYLFWLFAGGPPENKNLIYRSPFSPLQSWMVLYSPMFSLSLYCMVLYSVARSFKGLYCCIIVSSSLVLYCMVVQRLGWSFLVVYGP